MYECTLQGLFLLFLLLSFCSQFVRMWIIAYRALKNTKKHKTLSKQKHLALTSSKTQVGCTGRVSAVQIINIHPLRQRHVPCIRKPFPVLPLGQRCAHARALSRCGLREDLRQEVSSFGVFGKVLVTHCLCPCRGLWSLCLQWKDARLLLQQRGNEWDCAPWILSLLV